MSEENGLDDLLTENVVDKLLEDNMKDIKHRIKGDKGNTAILLFYDENTLLNSIQNQVYNEPFLIEFKSLENLKNELSQIELLQSCDPEKELCVVVSTHDSDNYNDSIIRTITLFDNKF